MSIKAFFEKRLQFFTGKGGVGKSTVVAGLAFLAAREGKRVLIVEIDTSSAMKRIFQAPFVGFEPMEVLDNLWVIDINPEEALLEYITERVKIGRLARKISENAILQYFFSAAPAVNEFMTLNKIYNLVHQKDPLVGQAEYDLILVDLPATGHALSFLGLPRTLRQLIGVGPVYKMIEKYERMLCDENRTSVNLVTLAEEMPVSETIELYEAALALNLPLGRLFVNAVPEQVFEPNEAQVLERLSAISDQVDRLDTALMAGRHALKRQKQSETYIERLNKRVLMSLVSLPRILVGHFDIQALRQLAAALQVRAGEEAL